MRLVENVGVRRTIAHPSQQFEILHETAPAGDYCTVVLDLTGYEDVTPLACRTIQDRMTMPIFSKPRSDDQPPQLAGARQQGRVELAVLEQAFELTRS